MTQTQAQRTRRLPQYGTREYWDASTETRELIEACEQLEKTLTAFDTLEFRNRHERFTDREPLMRWTQLMTGHLYDLEQEARQYAFAALDAEAAERAASEAAHKEDVEEENYGGSDEVED